MDSINELLINAIHRNDLDTINFSLKNGANVNKICLSGFTPLGYAAQTGNLNLLKALFRDPSITMKPKLDNFEYLEQPSGPVFLHLDMEKQDFIYKKNIGYFIVHNDSQAQDNGLDEGLTPDGMEALEWDMEVTNMEIDSNFDDPSDNIYKWYAKILNESSIILKPAEYDLSRQDLHGQTVLHYAVQFGSLEMVKYLLSLGSDISINQTDSNWNTPLHIACLKGDLLLTKFLIEEGANVNFANGKRQNPLHLAAQKGDIELVQLLIENGADINCCDKEESTALSVSISNSHESVAELLIRAGTQLNNEESSGFTVLYKAVWKNLYKVTEILLDSGAKITQSHFLLHLAIRNGNLDLVKLLHRKGAFLNVRDEQGNTALMASCIHKSINIAKYLLANGALVNSINQINGMTALHLCVQGIRETKLFQDFLQLFLLFHVDLNNCSYQGNVLFYSIALGNLEIAKVLVKQGVDVNRRDEHVFFDNLSLAKKQGDFELVKAIVYAGFNFRNLMFKLETLKFSEDDQVYQFLLECKRTPLNLRDLCRIVVRNRLKYNILRKIRTLPLPTLVIQYLSLDIL